jgi:hypothetical protein
MLPCSLNNRYAEMLVTCAPLRIVWIRRQLLIHTRQLCFHFASELEKSSAVRCSHAQKKNHNAEHEHFVHA